MKTYPADPRPCLVYYHSNMRQEFIPKKIRWVIHNLSRKVDLDRGRKRVTVGVFTSSDDAVVDIRFNGGSLGYFGIRTICKTLGLKMSGPFADRSIPMFGVIQ